MTIFFWALLIPYGVFVALFAILALVDIFHMTRFGTAGLLNFFGLFIFLAGTAVILWATAGLLQGVDWTAPITSGVSAEFLTSTDV